MPLGGAATPDLELTAQPAVLLRLLPAEHLGKLPQVGIALQHAHPSCELQEPAQACRCCCQACAQQVARKQPAAGITTGTAAFTQQLCYAAQCACYSSWWLCLCSAQRSSCWNSVVPDWVRYEVCSPYHRAALQLLRCGVSLVELPTQWLPYSVPVQPPARVVGVTTPRTCVRHT